MLKRSSFPPLLPPLLSPGPVSSPGPAPLLEEQDIAQIAQDVGLSHHDGTLSRTLVAQAADFLRKIGLEVRFSQTTGEARILKKHLPAAKEALGSLRSTLACILVPGSAADAGPSWYGGCPEPALRRNPYGAIIFDDPEGVGVAGELDDWEDDDPDDDEGDY